MIANAVSRVGLVWGVFDLFHEGHQRFLAWACSQASLLHVVVIPDEIAYQAKARWPIQSETTRVRNIRALFPACRSTIDCIDWGLQSVVLTHIDIVLLGSDQPEKWVARVASINGRPFPYTRCVASQGPRTTDLIGQLGEHFLRETCSQAEPSHVQAILEQSAVVTDRSESKGRGCWPNHS